MTQYTIYLMIKYPKLYAQASEWVGSLISYPTGFPRCTDFDSVTQNGEKILVIEAKRLLNGNLFVPFGQFKTLSVLFSQLKEPYFFIVGTINYSMKKSCDPVWVMDFKRIIEKKIPYKTRQGGIIIDSKNMQILTRRMFSLICDSILE